MVDARLGPSKLPLAWLTLAWLMAVRTSSSENPAAAKATGLTCTRTEGRWPPAMLTKPTPETCDKRWAMRFSTMSLTWVMGREGELRAKLKIGASAGLTLL